MFIPILGELPFPRGKTAADGLMTPTATWRSEIEGKAYWAQDTQHSTSTPVALLVVRNATGSAITVARKFAEFSVAAAKACVGKISTFPCDTAGGVALPLDDAMTVGASIPANDLFYVVLFGFCSVLTGSAVNNLSAGVAVTTDNAGLIANKSAPAAGEYVIGRLDYASSYSASTATRILVSPPALAPPSA